MVWPRSWWLQETSVPTAVSPGPLQSILSPSLLPLPKKTELVPAQHQQGPSQPKCPADGWHPVSLPRSPRATSGLRSAPHVSLDRAPLIECCGAVSGCQIFALPCVGWESFAFLFRARGGQREPGDAACISGSAGHPGWPAAGPTGSWCMNHHPFSGCTGGPTRRQECRSQGEVFPRDVSQEG